MPLACPPPKALMTSKLIKPTPRKRRTSSEDVLREALEVVEAIERQERARPRPRAKMIWGTR